MKGFNMQQMLKQAQQMQKKMEGAQEELRNTEIKAESGGGVICVKLNAKYEFKSIKIKPEAINPENPESVDEETIEMLEDLITSAMQEANRQVSETIEKKMGSVTNGTGINLPPGMF